MIRILVAYAERSKLERALSDEIALGIADELGASASIEVEAMSSLKRPERRDVYVLGAALENGRWSREAESFVIKNRFVLAHRPVALYATMTATTDPYSVACVRQAIARGRVDRFVSYQAPVRIPSRDLLGTALIGADALGDRGEFALWTNRISARLLRSRAITGQHLEACRNFGRTLGARIFQDHLEPPFLLDDVA